MSDRILIGVVVGANGVRGEVKIKSFTAAAADVAAYGPVTDEMVTRQLKLKVVGQSKGDVVEIVLEAGGTEFLPLTRRVFPLLDPKAGRAVIEPPLTVDAKADATRER